MTAAVWCPSAQDVAVLRWLCSFGMSGMVDVKWMDSCDLFTLALRPSEGVFHPGGRSLRRAPVVAGCQSMEEDASPRNQESCRPV